MCTRSAAEGALRRVPVKAHGGRIWADSAPGAGTTVSLELPGYQPTAGGAGIRP